MREPPFVELFADDSKLAAGLKRASRQLQSWGRSITAAGSSVAAFGAVGMGLALAMRAGMDMAALSFAETGAALARMSERTGISVEALSALKFAADQAGVEFEDLETGIKKMQKAIDAGNPALAKLGLNALALKKMSPEDALAAIGAKLEAIPNPTQRAATALAIFGKSGTKLLPMFNDLAGAMEGAGRAGVVMSTQDAQAALELDKAWRALMAQFKGLWVAIGAAFAPHLMEFAKEISRIVGMAIAWVKANAGLAESILKISAIILGASIAIQVLGFALAGFGTILSLIGTTLGALVGFIGFLLSVPGVFALIATAIFGLAGGFTLLRQAAAGIGNIVGQGWDTIVASIKAGDLTSAMKVAWAGIQLIWARGLDQLKIEWLAFKKDVFGTDVTNDVIKVIEHFEKARANYQKAIEDAKANLAPPAIGKIQSQGQAAAAAVIPLGSSRGTSNSFAALSLPGGSIPAKSLGELEQIRKLMGVVADNTANMGAQFL